MRDFNPYGEGTIGARMLTVLQWPNTAAGQAKLDKAMTSNTPLGRLLRSYQILLIDAKQRDDALFLANPAGFEKDLEGFK